MGEKKDVKKRFFNSRNLKSARDVTLAMLGGGLFALSLPKPEIPLAAWVCLVPLLFAIRGKRPYKASILGLIFGIAAYIGILYWTTYPISVYGGIPLPLAILFMILLVFYMALYISAFSAFVSWTAERFGLSEFVSVPIGFTALEYLKGILLTGFPWGFLGHSQLPYLPMMQVLDITGVFGVTFTIAAVNAAIYLVILKLIGQKDKFPITEVSISAVLVATLLVYGIYAINREESLFEKNPAITAALIQGNVRQDIKWDPLYQEETVSIYESLSLATREYDPDIVIWPETATPFFFDKDIVYRPRIEKLTKDLDAYLFFGAPAYEWEGEKVKYFNRAYLLYPEGEVVGYYDKMHLVPFGEYVPLRKVLFFIDKLVQAVGDICPGEITEPMETDFGPVGTLICYEAIFPDISRMFARKGASLLINITNDAWFGDTSAPYQHFSMARMRAIETRIPMIRVANTGISALIDTTGRVDLETRIFKRTFVVGEVRPDSRLSFYTRFGDVFAGLVVIAFFSPIFVHIYSIIRRKTRKEKP